MATPKFTVHEVIFEGESDSRGNQFRITIIEWERGGKKLDFRNWYDNNGELAPGKGAGISPEIQDQIAQALRQDVQEG